MSFALLILVFCRFFFCVSRMLCADFVRVSFCLYYTHQGTMRQDREVCCDSGLSRLAIVARPSRGSGLCAGSGGPCSERRLGTAAVRFRRVGPAHCAGTFRVGPALSIGAFLACNRRACRRASRAAFRAAVMSI
jgi:hypothetical protein